MLRPLLLISAVALIGVAVAAQASELGDKRQALMKKNGAAAAMLAGIAKGEKPYDAAVVKAALTDCNDDIKAFVALFAEGKPDDDGHAKAEIWDNMADFKAKASKLADDTDMYLANLPADQAAVGNALKTLGTDCNSCHEKYRMKR